MLLVPSQSCCNPRLVLSPEDGREGQAEAVCALSDADGEKPVSEEREDRVRALDNTGEEGSWSPAVG